MPRDHVRTVRIPLKRDVVTTETVAVGSLAVTLHDANRKLLDAEAALDRMLESVVGEYTNFEVGDRLELDVYSCTPSTAAVDALQRAGFSTVTLHEHDRSKFAKCACTRSRRPS